MRGKKTSGLFRRRLAAFLAVCMVASNLQGLSLAYGSEEIKPENAKLIQLDVEKLREAAEMAAQDGVLVTPPVTMATASDATPSTAVPFQNPAYELMDVSQLLAEGTAFPDETVVRIFLEPEMYEEEEKTADADSIELINDVQLEEELGDGYELTGNEKLIFYIENQGKEAQGYQIQFGDKVTGIIVAESSKNLLKEYEMGASDENAGPGATEGATEESTGAATEESTEESTEATTEESTEESTEAATEESTEESTEAATEESTEESTEATTEGATEESTEATTEGATEESTEAATEESIEESTEAETSGEESLGDNVDAGNTEEEDGEPEEEEAGEPAVEEGQADPENQTVGFLEKAVQFFTGTMTAYAAETATPSNEAVPTATGSNVIDTTKVEKKSFTNAENLENLTLLEVHPVNVLVEGGMEALQVGEPKAAFFSRMFQPEKEVTSAALFAVPMSLFAKAAEPLTRPNNYINLYNYASKCSNGDDIDSTGGTSANVINTYLKNNGMNLRFKGTGAENIDGFSGEWSAAYNNYGSHNNITMNIPENTNGVNRVNFDTLFPYDTDKVKTVSYNRKKYNAIDVYKNVNEEKLLTKEDEFLIWNASTGYYEYDSSNQSATFDPVNNTLTAEKSSNNDGFWPFGFGRFFFGMEVGFDFYKPRSGNYNGQPMVFEFSGDDDVWVYITDDQGKHLALDLGGIHGRVDGSIDFSTGIITYSAANLGTDTQDEETSDLINNIEDDLIEHREEGRDQRAYAYLYDKQTAQNRKVDDKHTYIEYVGLNSSAGTYHLTFYYLERGAGKSNCKLKFNLPVVPTNEILVTKEVENSGNADLKDMKYGFWLVSSRDQTALENYRKTGVSDPNIEVSETYIGIGTDGGEKVGTLAEGDFFYIEEINPGPKVEWEIIQNPGTVHELPGTGTDNSSSIYKVMKNGENGFHIKCTNIYEGLAPEQHKRAWKHNGSNDRYDVILDVTGDTNVVNEKEAKVQNPKVVDVVATEHAGERTLIFSDPVRDEDNEAVDAPNLYWRNGTVGAAGYRVTKLTARINQEQSVVNYYQNAAVTGKPVATYYIKENSASEIEAHTLTWNVAEKLGQNESRSLIYEVKAVGDYEEDPKDYPKTADIDTGTYSEVGGYWSNEEAYLEYTVPVVQVEQPEKDRLASNDAGTTTIQSKYLQPVIRPGKPDGVLKLTKIVEDPQNADPDDAAEFDFTILLTDLTVPEVQLPGGKTKEVSVDGTLTLDTPKLGHGESYQISNLNEGAHYTITENNFDDSEKDYISSLTKVTVDGEEIIPIPEDKSVSGTMPEAETEPDEDVEEKTIYKQTVPAVTTYTWKHWLYPNRYKVTAKDNDTDAMNRALNQVVRWLKNASYKDYQITKGTAQNGYIVSAEKWGQKVSVKPTKTTTPGYDYWEFKREKYRSLNELKEALNNDGYTCEIDADLNVTYWKQGSSEEENPTVESVDVVFTNTLEPLDTFTVEKDIVNNTLEDLSSKEFSFSVEKKSDNGTYSSFSDYTVVADTDSTASKGNGNTFTITGEGKVTIKIGKSGKDGEFKITESNVGGSDTQSWKLNGQSAVNNVYIEGVKDGDNAVCTNNYESNQLTIQKLLSDTSYKPSSDDAKKFQFKVRFTKDSIPLESVGVQEEKGVTWKDQPVDNVIALDKNGEVTFDLVAGESNKLVLDKIPTGTKYSVQELGWAGRTQDLAYYDYRPVGVQVDGGISSTTDQATGSFENSNIGAVDRDQQVTFTNEIFVKTGKLKIVKELTETDNVANAFRFEIVKNDNSGMKFYKTVVVKEGTQKAEVEVKDIPAGEYTITELDTLKYEIKDSSRKTQTVTVSASESQTATVTFVNEKTTNNYFTDTYVAVNKVTDDGAGGFEYVNADDLPLTDVPKNNTAGFGQPQALLSDKDEDDNDIV